MSFMDKVKSTADEAVSALSDAVSDVSGKGKEAAAKAKINKAVRDEEAKINNLYMYMGRKIFEDNQTAPAGFETQFEGIRNAKAEIERLKSQLNNAAADTVCPGCGKKVSPGQSFCPGCGAKLK